MLNTLNDALNSTPWRYLPTMNNFMNNSDIFVKMSVTVHIRGTTFEKIASNWATIRTYRAVRWLIKTLSKHRIWPESTICAQLYSRAVHKMFSQCHKNVLFTQTMLKTSCLLKRCIRTCCLLKACTMTCCLLKPYIMTWCLLQPFILKNCGFLGF